MSGRRHTAGCGGTRAGGAEALQPPGGGERSSDEQRLADLGYRQELPRVLHLWTNWAVGFAFISPIVGLYTIVALGATTAGPPWVWSLPVVVAGQFLVALVYARLSSHWPIAGGIYQWSRRLLGRAYGWWAGWAYLWALVIVLATTAYAGGGFLGQLLGVSTSSTTSRLLLALVVMAAFTGVNAVGLALLRYTVNIGIACELIASVGIGITLLVFFRHQPVSILVHAPHLTHSSSSYPAAFLGAVAFTGWAILGFDACGGLSEETRDASRQVPRATLLSIATVGSVMAISALGLTLATRNEAAVTAGRVADPVASAVVGSFGLWVERPFLAVVVIGFVACGIAEQATLVRVIYSLSRDGMLPGSRLWRAVSPRNQSPTFAVLLSGVLATAAVAHAKVLAVLVDFATGAYYVGFLFPVVAVGLGVALLGIVGPVPRGAPTDRRELTRTESAGPVRVSAARARRAAQASGACRSPVLAGTGQLGIGSMSDWARSWASKGELPCAPQSRRSRMNGRGTEGSGLSISRASRWPSKMQSTIMRGAAASPIR
jgi:amino acid transporter